MAGAFEAFVQQELPLRPFTSIDGNQEAIAIRRGLGPRQMQFLDLEDNQVLARVDGVLTGISINIGEGGGAGGVRHYIANVQAGSEQSTWTLNHDQNSKNMVANVYILNEDQTLQLVIPDSFKIIDSNNVEFKFSAPIAGKAILSFVD